MNSVDREPIQGRERFATPQPIGVQFDGTTQPTNGSTQDVNDHIEVRVNGHRQFGNGNQSGVIFENSSTVAISERKPHELLDKYVAVPGVASLGEAAIRTDIRSSIGPFLYFPERRVHYPEAVTRALGELYDEYNRAFTPLVEANREWETDYQFAFNPDGTPVNGWVQIDMVGLPDQFLEAANYLNPRDVRDVLKGRIFEIENSLAMYQLLATIFSHNGHETFFKKGFRESLDEVRRKHGRPIALLAVTEQKYRAMRESEFGKMDGETLTDEEVKELSGFDKFFGPEEFVQYLAENGGESAYLLYARTSDPVAKLKKPNKVVENPLLENDEVRRLIKAHSITFNVDNPAWPSGDPRRINDTKEYLPTMGMAYPVLSLHDILVREFMDYLSNGKPYAEYPDGNRLTPGFKHYLRSRGIDPVLVEKGEVALRAKPMKGTYGCYGHLTETLEDKKFRQELRQNIDKRGPYVIQPELETPIIINKANGQAYTYIDRNFFAFPNGNPRFLGGFRSFMPVDSTEAMKGRNHGNHATVWMEVS